MATELEVVKILNGKATRLFGHKATVVDANFGITHRGDPDFAGRIQLIMLEGSKKDRQRSFDPGHLRMYHAHMWVFRLMKTRGNFSVNLENKFYVQTLHFSALAASVSASVCSAMVHSAPAVIFCAAVVLTISCSQDQLTRPQPCVKGRG
jgi:hypothetical protein